MGLSDGIWLLFLLFALQPMLRQRLLVAGRRRLIARLERRHQSRVIALVHRQEMMSVLGFPLARFINIEDSEEVLRAIQLTDPKRNGQVRSLAAIAERLGCSLSQLAIAWCAANPNVSTVITGASRSEQVTENLGAMAVLAQLTPDVMAEIADVVKK